jgi:hypothetical protein
MEPRRSHWSFSSYVEELIFCDEISENPDVHEYRNTLIDEVWERFPKECIEFHLVERKAA